MTRFVCEIGLRCPSPYPCGVALFSANELRYADDRATWWLRARDEAGPILVWTMVALTVYSGLGYTWRHREVIAPDQ